MSFALYEHQRTRAEDISGLAVHKLETIRCSYGLFSVEVDDSVPDGCVMLKGNRNSVLMNIATEDIIEIEVL